MKVIANDPFSGGKTAAARRQKAPRERGDLSPPTLSGKAGSANEQQL